MYKLSKTLREHTGDVKGVKITDHGVLSVSRDGTALVDAQPVLELGVYLNACTTSDQYVYAGAQDGTIAGINLAQPDENAFYMGHTANVCALDAQNDTLISGSWDKSARVWKISDPSVPPLVLEGHTQAVWAVLILGNGEYLTAGADKRIIRWNNNHQAQVYEGHTDAVRGLCSIDATTFASCSNDNTVRVWKLDGSSTVLKGHSSFVYSVAYASGTLFSAGEDRTVRVWKQNKLVQTVTLPSVSQWSVDARGTEFAVGSSDHTTRIFSSDPQNWAPKQDLEEFSAALSASSLGEDQVGKIDESQLKPESHIQKPGKEGEIALVKSNGTVNAHQFSAGQWTKVGQVMGKSSDGAKASYQGKQYDYVFDVDIRDGEPALKLPFNNSDNPYLVAEKFVAENDLPAVYVEQVVQFLIKNSETSSLGGLSTSASAPAQAPTSGSGSGSGRSAAIPELLHYNKTLAMSTFQQDPLVRAFTTNATKHGENIPIESILTSLPGSAQELIDTSLKAINSWGVDDMLPALDTLRLAIPAVATIQFLPVFTALLSCLDEGVPKHAMLATRGFANMLARHDAYEIVQRNPQPLQQGFKMLASFSAFTKPMQIAVATVCLNAAINDSKSVAQYITTLAKKLEDPEAIYRLALAIGVLTAKGYDVAGQLTQWLQQVTEKRSQDLVAAIAQASS